MGFKRSPAYQETYLSKIYPYPKLRAKFRDFMELKRHNPMQPFGASDKHFKSGWQFDDVVPGIKHAHITHDISIVYEYKNGEIYLYGFYTHDELGTGQPPNINKQKSMATRFANQTFVEEFRAYDPYESVDTNPNI